MRFRAAVVLAMILGVAVFAQRSQPASNATGTQQQPAAVDPRGTNESPLIVRVQPTPETANKKASEQADASARSSTQALAWFTAVLALAQLVAIGYQATITKWQAAIAARQNRIIKRQNQIMQGQRTAADTQSGYMREALTETRAAYHAAHRGSMAVRPIRFNGFDDSGHIGGDLTNGTVRITNIGPVNVTLRFVYARWLFATHLPVTNPAVLTIGEDVDYTEIPPGYFTDRHIDDFTADIGVFIPFNNNMDAVNRGAETLPHAERLYLLGYVKFSDPIGMRRTYFCYQFDPFVRSFVPVEHPHYTYQE